MTQAQLFGAAAIESSIEGLVYQPEFLSQEEERELLAIVQTLPLHAARYKQYLARRRVVAGYAEPVWAAHTGGRSRRSGRGCRG